MPDTLTKFVTGNIEKPSFSFLHVDLSCPKVNLVFVSIFGRPIKSKV